MDEPLRFPVPNEPGMKAVKNLCLRFNRVSKSNRQETVIVALRESLLNELSCYAASGSSMAEVQSVFDGLFDGFSKQIETRAAMIEAEVARTEGQLHHVQ